MMLRKVLIGTVVVLVALICLNFLTTGEFSLIPAFPASAEGRALDRLDERCTSAIHQLNMAERSSGTTGMDMTSEAQAALLEMEKVESELTEMRGKAGSESMRSRIDDILAKIHRVRESHR